MSKVKKVLNAATIAERISEVETNLSQKLKLENFIEKDISTIYNPLEYAKEPHEYYLKKWCNTQREVMFLGMNPGPFGMCQNGIPFGEIDTVKNWLQIKGKVNKPEKEDPNRPIEGMNVKRNEVSGNRLWNLFKRIAKTPEVFFQKCIVYNFIPLCFIGKSGKNIAPDSLKPNVRNKLIRLCGDSLCEIIDILQVKTVVCVGKWTEARINEIKKEKNLRFKVLGIMHPSPLNPKSRDYYLNDAEKDLERLDILKYIRADENTQQSAIEKFWNSAKRKKPSATIATSIKENNGDVKDEK